MAVTACVRSRTGDSSKGDHKHSRSHTLAWDVYTDNPLDDGYDVLSQGPLVGPDPIPGIYYGHPSDIFAYAKDATATRDSNDPKKWSVSVNYDNKAPDPRQNDPNPLARPTKYKIEWANFTKIVTKDINGNEILNAAGEEFDPPIEIDDSRPVLVATKNVSSLTTVINLARQYKNAINTNTFYGAPPRHANVQAITAGDEQRENNVYFYVVTIRVEISETTWEKEILNQGFRHFDNAVPKNNPGGGAQKILVAARGEDNNLLNAPVNLYGGTPPGGAPDAQAKWGYRIPTAAAGAVQQKGRFLKFKVYPEKDFSGLGI